MSSFQRTYFFFIRGLSASLYVPKGTLAGIQQHVAQVEKRFSLKIETYKNGSRHWCDRSIHAAEISKDIKDEDYCNWAQGHNDWMRWLYGKFCEWSEKPAVDGETITPEDAEQFWHALCEIPIPLTRWTQDYFKSRMDHAYRVMRGQESEGIKLFAPELTPQQAGAVIRIFSDWLDLWDTRLEVCRDMDELTEEYHWCEQCGEAIYYEDSDAVLRECSKGRYCPLADYYPEEDLDELFPAEKARQEESDGEEG